MSKGTTRLEVEKKACSKKRGRPKGQAAESIETDEFILKLISQGRSEQQIADTVYLSVYSVKKRKTNILREFGLEGKQINDLKFFVAFKEGMHCCLDLQRGGTEVTDEMIDKIYRLEIEV